MKTIGKILLLFLVITTTNAMANYDENEKTTNNSSSSITLSISGQVVDKITGEALTGVAVKIDSETIAYTDFEGNFSITVKNKESISINANLISYSPESIEINPSKSNKIKLELKPIED